MPVFPQNSPLYTEKLIFQLSPGALMAKTDIKSAFRIIPIHPEYFELISFQLGGLFYCDKVLPMGASVLTINRSIQWITVSNVMVSITHSRQQYLPWDCIHTTMPARLGHLSTFVWVHWSLSFLSSFSLQTCYLRLVADEKHIIPFVFQCP